MAGSILVSIRRRFPVAMLGFIFRRFLQTIPLLLLVSFITFFLINSSPGSYIDSLRADPHIPEEYINGEIKRLGLDQPWIVIYFNWLKGLLHGNFGISFKQNRPVIDILRERTWNTFLMSLCGMAFAWLVGVPLGIIAGAKQYSWYDKVASGISFVGLSVPSVFIALVAIFVAAKYEIGLPTGGIEDDRHASFSPWGKFLDTARHLVLPTIILGSSMTAVYMRQMRGSLLDVLRSDFVRTARAKGLSERVVIAKHAVRNAINPLITLFGYSLSDLLSGAFLVEVVLSLPGLGRTTIEAVRDKDLFLVNATVLVATAMLVFGNLIADFLLVLSDPRISFKSREA